MILCVTLNPCLDKTLVVPPWRPGDAIRGTAVREVVGGKGNNVARALKRLGRPARPVMFLGGPLRDHCEALLRRDDALEPLVTPTTASTRVILTIRTEGSDDQTAFFDPDPEISDAEAAALYHRVEGAIASEGVELITLSGSSPGPAADGLYSDLIALARAQRIPILLDTYGAALDAIWGFWPDVMQLNRREAATHLRRPLRDLRDDDVFSLLDEWTRHGVRLSLVTDGPGPVLAQARGRSYRAEPAAVDVVNPIGSGDSPLAGLADAWLAGLEPAAMIRRALACAAVNAAVWDAGALDAEEVRRLEPAITIEPVDRPEPNHAPVMLVRKTERGAGKPADASHGDGVAPPSRAGYPGKRHDNPDPESGEPRRVRWLYCRFCQRRTREESRTLLGFLEEKGLIFLAGRTSNRMS